MQTHTTKAKERYERACFVCVNRMTRISAPGKEVPCVYSLDLSGIQILSVYYGGDGKMDKCRRQQRRNWTKRASTHAVATARSVNQEV